jgi:hypothetical protein
MLATCVSSLDTDVNVKAPNTKPLIANNIPKIGKAGLPIPISNNLHKKLVLDLNTFVKSVLILSLYLNII